MQLWRLLWLPEDRLSFLLSSTLYLLSVNHCHWKCTRLVSLWSPIKFQAEFECFTGRLCMYIIHINIYVIYILDRKEIAEILYEFPYEWIYIYGKNKLVKGNRKRRKTLDCVLPPLPHSLRKCPQAVFFDCILCRLPIRVPQQPCRLLPGRH